MDTIKRVNQKGRKESNEECSGPYTAMLINSNIYNGTIERLHLTSLKLIESTFLAVPLLPCQATMSNIRTQRL